MTGPRPLQRRVLPTPRSVWEIEISRDGRLLVAACGESVVLWDLAGPKPSERTRLKTDALSVSISPDGKTLATGASFREETIRVWSLEQGEPKERMVLANVAQGGITALEFSPDGTLLASSAGTQDTIRLWKTRDGRLEEHAVLTGHVAKVFDLAFSPDGRQLASVASDHTLRLWEMGDRPRESDVSQSAHEGLSSQRSYTRRKLRCLRDGRSMLSGSSRGPALFDMIDRRIRIQCDMSHGDTYLLRPMHLAPDENTLATVENINSADDAATDAKCRRAVALWDLSTGKRLRTLSTQPGPLSGLIFSRDSRQLATASTNGKFRVWDVTSGDLIVTSPAGSQKTRLWLFDDDTLISTDNVVSNLGEPQVEIQMWHRRGNEFAKGKSWATPRSDTGVTIVGSDDRSSLAIQNRGRNIEVWEISNDGVGRRTNIDFTDNHLQRLGRIDSLRFLVLDSTSVSDEAIASLKNELPYLTVHRSYRRTLEAIEELGGKVTDYPIMPGSTKTSILHPSVSFFARGYARRVDLSGLHMDEEMVRRVTDLPRLETLHLGYNELQLRGCKDITDEGFLRLREMQNLKSVDLQRTNISPTCLSQLREALPKCAFKH